MRMTYSYTGMLAPKVTRESIERFEAGLFALEDGGAGVPIDTRHDFADGLVSRTIFVPAGTYLTGCAHKAEHLNIAQGDITVWTEDGMRRLKGFHVLPSRPGAKRVGYAHADTWWVTVHANPENIKDPVKLEDALVEEPHKLQSRRMAIETRAFEVLA